MAVPNKMPDRLCLKDGVLTMRDGSDVQEYLRARPMANAPEVVLLTRELAERLAHEAYLYRMSQVCDDERFALAA